tara:strand:- start:2367 stop:3278 length:912 start_codon:yes stop_codon:yes gene_type:complete
MSNEVSLIDTNNYAAMAQAMGMVAEQPKEKKSNLPRLRMLHSGIMGEKVWQGETLSVEVIKAGSYRLELPNGEYVYSETIAIRPFIQRFMYKRFIKNMAAKAGEKKGDFCKTVMADNLNIDLKDNMGGFNCGKPAGFVQDFKSLPESTQKLIKDIKRVRVIFGLVKLNNPLDEKGNKVKQEEVPFIWEVDNREAFKITGIPFGKLSQMKRLLPQHNIKLSSVKGQSGSGTVVYYLPVAELDLSKQISISDDDQKSFSLFLDFVQVCNDSVVKEWEYKTKNNMKQVDRDVVDDFIDIESGKELS